MIGIGHAIRLLLLVQVLGFAFMVAGTHGAFAPQPVPHTTTDFASFYAAGTLAGRGTPQAAYDPVAHRAAEWRAVAPGVDEKPFFYPPPFLLICAGLAHLPYMTAFVLFEAATAALWLTLSCRIAGGGIPTAMAMAAIPSVWWALGWGQNSFLTASLMAAGTLLLGRAPLLAGVAFGALCIKPHLGVLIPVALLSGRHWRAILGAALCSIALCAASAACFGLGTWRAFLAMVLHARPALEASIALAAHVDPGGAARLLGLPPAGGTGVQAAAMLLAAICVAMLWAHPRGGASAERQAFANAGLVAATLVAAPFLLFYDLVLAGIAAAWLVRGLRLQGALREAPVLSVRFKTCSGESAGVVLRASERSGRLAMSTDAQQKRVRWPPERVFKRTLIAAIMLDLLAYPAACLLHLAAGALVGPALLLLALRGARSTRIMRHLQSFNAGMAS